MITLMKYILIKYKHLFYLLFFLIHFIVIMTLNFPQFITFFFFNMMSLVLDGESFLLQLHMESVNRQGGPVLTKRSRLRLTTRKSVININSPFKLLARHQIQVLFKRIRSCGFSLKMVLTL